MNKWWLGKNIHTWWIFHCHLWLWEGSQGQRLNRLNLLHYPLVNKQRAIENCHRNSGFTHWKWWFSIVMLVYQRVYIYIYTVYIYIYLWDVIFLHLFEVSRVLLSLSKSWQRKDHHESIATPKWESHNFTSVYHYTINQYIYIIYI